MTAQHLPDDRLPEIDANESRGSLEGPVGVEASAPGPFLCVGHEALFEPETPRCDACDGALESAGSDGGDGGHGLYVWVRHGNLVYEEPPLCEACASAITISALQRWEIEEEEG